MVRSNFHTHTTFCDGKDSPRELVEQALLRGFDALGFSGHSFVPFDTEGCMSPECTLKYVAEINALKSEYEGKIQLLCGIEQDIFSDIEREQFDYVIGSAHYIKIGGEYLSVDLTPELAADIIRTHFAGDFDSYAAAYFETVSEVCEQTKCDIIGHVDLVIKYADLFGYTQSDRYLAAAESAIKLLSRYNVPFEINTGVTVSGMRRVPYPTAELLGMIKSQGGSVILSSDCHDKNYLDFGFDKATELAKQAGFESVKVLLADGYGEIEL